MIVVAVVVIRDAVAIVDEEGDDHVLTFDIWEQIPSFSTLMCACKRKVVSWSWVFNNDTANTSSQ